MTARWKVVEGDLRRPVLLDVGSEPFDAVLCDPPYELGFMGKRWDASGVAFSVKTWQWVFQQLRPGAPLIAFGGTRTYHRMTCAIEDSGFEIRDCLMWLYGSGFPKSLDISKAIDKDYGHWRGRAGAVEGHSVAMAGPRYARTEKGEPVTAAAAAWEGWGTALKPAWESAILCEKPLDISGLVLRLIACTHSAVRLIPSFANTANCRLPSKLRERVVGDLGSVLWSAVASSNTPADLFGVMGTSLSGSEMPLSLSIAFSWLAILDDLLRHASTCTTETESSLTTDLIILNSSPSKITPESILLAATYQLGASSDASHVDAILRGASAKLALIQTCSVRDDATSTVGGKALLPEWEPAVLAQKPLDGTVAENALKHGVGGIAIDASRIPYVNKADQAAAAQRLGPSLAKMDGGRWPANVVLDEEAASQLDEQSGNRPGMSGGGKHRDDYEGGMFGGIDSTNTARGDNGGASRFFYTAKASSAERDSDLQERDSDLQERDSGVGALRDGGRGKKAINNHPTLKPVALTEYLAKLILPPRIKGRTRRLLVPFSGAASEMIGALRAGWDEVVGIEQSPEYAKIARLRLERMDTAWRSSPQDARKKPR